MKLRERVGRMLLGALDPAPGPLPAPAVRPFDLHDVQRDAAVKELLEACAKGCVPRGRHVRANVMTFSADRSRRRVNRSTAFNMENDPDCDLEVDATASASGKAVSDRRAAVADLALLQITAAPTWGLRPSEQARVRPTLRSVLSVPVFNPHDVDGSLLGTLQVDSDLTVEEAGFNRHEAAELLQRFADVLSLLMIDVAVPLADASVEFRRPAPESRVQNATQVEAGLYVANTSTSIFQLPKGR
jgi:hypothetical protein